MYCEMGPDTLDMTWQGCTHIIITFWSCFLEGDRRGMGGLFYAKHTCIKKSNSRQNGPCAPIVPHACDTLIQKDDSVTLMWSQVVSEVRVHNYINHWCPLLVVLPLVRIQTSAVWETCLSTTIQFLHFWIGKGIILQVPYYICVDYIITASKTDHYTSKANYSHST